jgi:hypothetical protein
MTKDYLYLRRSVLKDRELKLSFLQRDNFEYPKFGQATRLLIKTRRKISIIERLLGW